MTSVNWIQNIQTTEMNSTFQPSTFNCWVATSAYGSNTSQTFQNFRFLSILPQCTFAVFKEASFTSLVCIINYYSVHSKVVKCSWVKRIVTLEMSNKMTLLDITNISDLMSAYCKSNKLKIKLRFRCKKTHTALK